MSSVTIIKIDTEAMEIARDKLIVFERKKASDASIKLPFAVWNAKNKNFKKISLQEIKIRTREKAEKMPENLIVQCSIVENYFFSINENGVPNGLKVLAFYNIAVKKLALDNILILSQNLCSSPSQKISAVLGSPLFLSFYSDAQVSVPFSLKNFYCEITLKLFK